ncbi:DUF1292 domain-containing protein [Bacillus salitolerans]|uniref:DUF1292 domain-containing protein n=1 Tax=Bacillus salitolerans TaxID=1437434 RepID=A0ABW4LXM3_9BACI
MELQERDFITIEDENGSEKEYSVEALFHQGEESYALLDSDDETLLMKVENEDGEQYLVGIEDEEETESILSAYQIAVEAANRVES